MAVGCSHGELIDAEAEKAVLGFKQRFKPKRIFHLGDWCDTAALRAGAKGTEDEGKPINCDLDTGLNFLKRLGVTDCTMGNHDQRPYRYLEHPNAMVRTLGEMLVEGIEKRMRAMKINWLNKWTSSDYIAAYGYKFMHGTAFGVGCARKMAMNKGKVIFAHAHVPREETSERDDQSHAICVGTLIDVKRAGYAAARDATNAWGHALVYGEGYGDKMGYVQLAKRLDMKSEWRLPI